MVDSKPILCVDSTISSLLASFDLHTKYITVPEWAKDSDNDEVLDDYRLESRTHCKCQDNCGKDCACANDILSLECAPGCLCNFMECQNRKLQKGLAVELEIRYISPDKGFGVFATSPIPKNQFICEYVGELLKEYQVPKRKNTRYLMHIREIIKGNVLSTYIDSHERGNVARFFNHSCDPNAFLQIIRTHYTVPQVGLFAARNILKGEELCFNYGSTIGKAVDKAITLSLTPCLCGAKNCKGFLPALAD